MGYSNNQGQVIIQHDNDEVSSSNPLPVSVISGAATAYIMHDLAVSGSITYIGKENTSGTWLLTQIDESNGVVLRYANVSNNSGYTTYATAWTNRATLDYDYLENITGV